MSRERTINVGILNVSMSKPHKQKRYFELFRHAVNLGISAPLREKFTAQLSIDITDCQELPEFLVGAIQKFYDLDVKSQWFDKVKGEVIDGKNNDIIKRIPDNIKPDYKEIPFVFYLKKHLLFFVSKEAKLNLSPKIAKVFLIDYLIMKIW